MEKTKKKIVKKVTKKAKTQNAKKAPTKKITDKKVAPKKIVQTKKDEPWYVWLRHNIIESDNKYTGDKRRLFTSLFMIFCFLAVVFATSIIDYSLSVKKDSEPLFTISQHYDEQQITVHYGVFYKAWKCDNGDEKIKFGTYKSDITHCDIIPVFNEDNIYTNPNGVKISKAQMESIYSFYSNDFVKFENEGDLNDAYKISNALNRLLWATPAEGKPIKNDADAKIAIFKGLTSYDGISKWELQYNNYDYYKCYKLIDNKFAFAEYNSSTNTCSNNWKPLKLDEEICILANNNIELVRNIIRVSRLCE